MEQIFHAGEAAAQVLAQYGLTLTGRNLRENAGALLHYAKALVYHTPLTI